MHQVSEAGFAYSSVTAHGGYLYLLYEAGPKQFRRLAFQRLAVDSLAPVAEGGGLGA